MVNKSLSLYDCIHARYPAKGSYILCDKGHTLGNGYVNKSQADRNAPLICGICQLCRDVEEFETRWEK